MFGSNHILELRTVRAAESLNDALNSINPISLMEDEREDADADVVMVMSGVSEVTTMPMPGGEHQACELAPNCGPVPATMHNATVLDGEVTNEEGDDTEQCCEGSSRA